jgi:acetyltransferase-like isoleucine patch superfamily enzyme
MAAGHKRLTKTQAAVTGDQSALARYQEVVVGHPQLLGLVYYEFCLWLAWVPGALGLLLRRIFWPRLFGSCGKKVYFGSNITLMHPHRIRLGDRIVIGNGCVLDARTPSSDVAIAIGNDVILSQGGMLSCKNANIRIGDRVGIGPYTVVQATNDDSVLIDEDAIVAAHCCIVGGGQYQMDRLDVPIARQPMRSTGGTRVEAGVWLGSHVNVLGGVTVGRDTVVGAGSVVVRSLPERAVCVGVPARVVRRRDEQKSKVDQTRAS